MANFAVTLVRGPNWDRSRGIREQQDWDAHAAFMDSLLEDGFILVGGPVGDQRQTLHVVEADDELEVRRRLSEDPWALSELLQIGSIEPWALWLDFRSAGTTARQSMLTPWSTSFVGSRRRPSLSTREESVITAAGSVPFLATLRRDPTLALLAPRRPGLPPAASGSDSCEITR